MTTTSIPTPSQTSSPAATPLNDINSSSRPPLLSLFYAFHIIGGHIGFPLLLVAVFALGNASSRHPLFINFCVTWVFSSIVFCILLYAGYDTGPDPPFMICALQASLVYAMPIMSATSLTALVFHLWLCLRGSMNQAIMTRSGQIQWALVGLPYLLALPYIIAPALIAGLNPDTVARRRSGFGYFCSVDSHSLRTGVSFSIVALLVLLLVWEFLVGQIFYKNWRSVRTVKVYGWSGANLITRIALLTLYILLGIVACVVAVALPRDHFRILFQASLPTVSFLLFATRPNLWRRQDSTSPSSMDPSLNPSHKAFNAKAATSSSFVSGDGADLEREQSTFSSAPRSMNMPIAATRANSTDMDRVAQVKRASTFLSVESGYGWTEKGGADRDVPALPVQAPNQRLPEDVGTWDTIVSGVESEGTAWTASTQNPASWEGVRGPDAVEKGIHQSFAQADDSASIRSVGGQPQRWI